MSCQRCIQHDVECCYDERRWQSKDSLRHENERLRSELQGSNLVLAALARSPFARHIDQWLQEQHSCGYMDYLPDRRHQMADFVYYDSDNALLKATGGTDLMADQMMTQTNLSPIGDGGFQHYVEPQPMLVAPIGAAMDDRFPLGTFDETPNPTWRQAAKLPPQ